MIMIYTHNLTGTRTVLALDEDPAAAMAQVGWVQDNVALGGVVTLTLAVEA